MWAPHHTTSSVDRRMTEEPQAALYVGRYFKPRLLNPEMMLCRETGQLENTEVFDGKESLEQSICLAGWKVHHISEYYCHQDLSDRGQGHCVEIQLTLGHGMFASSWRKLVTKEKLGGNSSDKEG